MKSAAFAVAAFAAMVAAQNVSYTTVTSYTDYCSPDPYTSTTTGTVTSVYCDMCTDMSSSSGVWTTYTTVMADICSTGSTLTPVTYTVTEPCSETGQPMSEHVPAGFTTSVGMCSCTGGSATITKPAATPAPAASGSAPAAPVATGAAPAAAGGTAPAAAPVPESTAAAQTMTVPMTHATPAANLSSNGTYGTPAAPIMPGAGARPVLSGFLSAVAAAIVATLVGAFTL